MLPFITRITASMALLAGAIGGAALILRPEGLGETVVAVVVGAGVFAVADWAVHCVRYEWRLRRLDTAT